MDSAIAYNKKNAIPIPLITSHSVDSMEYALAVKTFQEKIGIKADGKMGPTTLSHVRQYILNTQPSKMLDRTDYERIAKIVSEFEGKPWSVNRDGEYRGLFDKGGKKHWASGNTHIGLSFGFIQFTQDGGKLGVLLKKMHKTDSGKFKEIFGEHSEELLDVTNRSGKERVDGRSPRVQPIGGYDLWDDYWVDRFKKSGKYEPFQRAQYDLAVDDYMMPAIQTCRELGFSSERALAIVFDRSVQYGPRGAKNLILKVGGPKKEHLRLLHLVNTWEGKRWHHRPQSLFMNQTLMDCTCVFG